MAELVLVTGPPGAGKSTVSRRLVQAFERVALIPGDEFFGFVDRGAVAPWLPAAEAQNRVVTTAAAAACGAFVQGGLDVVYDGMVGPWFVDTFLAATGLHRLHFMIVMPPVDVCVDRVRTRAGHGFTDLSAARHMHAEFARAAIDPRFVLTGPPDDPGATADLVRERWQSGRLAYPS